MAGDVEVAVCNGCNNLKPVSRKYYKYNIECECCHDGKHVELVRFCDKCTPRPPQSITAEIRPIDDDRFLFRPGRFYKHTDGHMLHTLEMSNTTMWGRTLIAEMCPVFGNVELIAVGTDSESYTQNYVEIDEAVWMTKFSKE